MSPSTAWSIALTYPEESPFERVPPVDNLIPEEPPALHQITPDIASNALKEARETGVNPLYEMYGLNPLVIRDSDELNAPPLYLDNYARPPPLPCIEVENITFIVKLNPKGRTPVYKVSVGGDTRILKLYTDREPDEEPDPREAGWPMFRFRREREAYAHLLHAGLCKKGIIPFCYGWFELSRADVEALVALPLDPADPEYEFMQRSAYEIECEGPDTPYRHPTYLDDRRPPKALLLEYLPDAQPLSISNITPEIADTVLKNLYQIHAAYVMHGDVHRRNILLLPGDRVVWIDFDEATCGSETKWRLKLTRQKLLFELAMAWAIMYSCLLVDKRINFINWLD